jgi:glutamate racemase
MKNMPGESFVYYGDSANAPYGARSPEEVRSLTDAHVRELIGRGAKAIVIACNTATGAAIQYLREKYTDIPIIGMEPAIKPAVTAYPGGRILVMATPVTLSSPGFQRLMAAYADRAQILPAPCAKLARMIENGLLDGPEVEEYLRTELSAYLDTPTDAVVLGCTHYPFAKAAILRVSGAKACFDGGEGTAKETKRQLEKRGWLNEDTRRGTITILNSDPDLSRLRFCEKLLGVDADK